MIDAIAAAQSTRMIAAAQLSLIYETTAGTAISQETQDLNQRTGRIRVWMKPLSTRSAHMSVVSQSWDSGKWGEGPGEGVRETASRFLLSTYPTQTHFRAEPDGVLAGQSLRWPSGRRIKP